MAVLLMRRDQVPAYIEKKFGFPCAKATLTKLASIGGGPSFYKAGRFPMYHPDDIDSWCIARLGQKRCSAKAE